jgi:hypothetical protein
MKRIVKLTESDLTRIVRRVISEQEATQKPTMPSFPDVNGSCQGSTLKPVGGITETGRRVLRMPEIRGGGCKPVKNVAIDCQSNQLLNGVTVVDPTKPNFFTKGNAIVSDVYGTNQGPNPLTQPDVYYPNVADINSSEVKDTLKGYCSTLLKYYTDLNTWKKTQKPK